MRIHGMGLLGQAAGAHPNSIDGWKGADHSITFHWTTRWGPINLHGSVSTQPVTAPRFVARGVVFGFRQHAKIWEKLKWDPLPFTLA